MESAIKKHIEEMIDGLQKFHKTLSSHSLFFCLMSFVLLNGIFFLSAGYSYAGQATLSWNAPTTNTDGTPLTDLAGYKVYYGTATGTYTQNINVRNVTTYTVPNLTDGLTYFFTVTAYDTASNESGYSNEVSKTIGTSSLQYTLTVYRAGTGSGNVTSSPSGISCGSSCSASYSSGTAVTLTAAPDASSTFAGWSGACTGTGTCTVTINSAQSVTATFTLKTYTISASAGTGGTISPSGSVLVNYGTNQSFTITANAGCSITNVLADGASVVAVSIYTFSNVTANHTISANFSTNTNILTVSKTGTGTGTITSSPAGINCGSTCSYAYNSGTAITLTASPNASSTFAGWSGACTGTGTCSVTMNSAQSAAATFTLKTYTITASAGTGGSISPSGTVSINSGANQTFAIAANSGYIIADVVVDGSSVGTLSSYTFANVATNHTISANFADSSSNASDLPKTGLTYSYAPGDDGYVQAGINWPNPRFTDNGDGTATDNLTGLMWLKDGSCLKTNWTTALQSIASFNSSPAGYSCQEYAASYSDWRLPDVKELGSLINYGQSNLAAWLNSIGFCNIKYSSYWSSTTYQGQTSNAWLVNMNNGAEITGSKVYSYYVMPVRSALSGTPYEIPKTGQTVSYASGDDGYVEAGNGWPAVRFTDNGDGTMTDNLTGLMWLKDAGCLSENWSSALTTIAGINTNPTGYSCQEYAASYSDWRLPNVNEIESLINFGDANSTSWLGLQGFMNVKSSYYWSSTTYQNNTSQAWGLKLTKGRTATLSKKYSYSVWPVRGGKLK